MSQGSCARSMATEIASICPMPSAPPASSTVGRSVAQPSAACSAPRSPGTAANAGDTGSPTTRRCSEDIPARSAARRAASVGTITMSAPRSYHDRCPDTRSVTTTMIGVSGNVRRSGVVSSGWVQTIRSGAVAVSAAKPRRSTGHAARCTHDTTRGELVSRKPVRHTHPACCTTCGYSCWTIGKGQRADSAYGSRSTTSMSSPPVWSASRIACAAARCPPPVSANAMRTVVMPPTPRR